MALREQKADNTGGYSIQTESVFLTSAAASKSAPAVVDEELTHSLYWENIKKIHKFQLTHLQLNISSNKMQYSLAKKKSDVVLIERLSYLVVSCMLGPVCLLAVPFPPSHWGETPPLQAPSQTLSLALSSFSSLPADEIQS